MAEASQENTTANTISRRDLANRISILIQRNSLEKIKKILEILQPEQRIAILNTTTDGYLPIYEAIKLNNVEISRYFLEHSLPQGLCEMSEHWKHCGHPLIAAIKAGNPELIQLILHHIPDINDKITGPLPPLLVAIFHGDLMSVKLIVAMRADVNRPFFQGRVPLMHSTGNSEICRFLLSKVANVNHRDEDGFTALHLAVDKNHIESVNLLVDAGADVRIRNYEGITPLIWASIDRKMPVCLYLSQQPACSELERIESLELLNASSVCSRRLDLEKWKEALVMRKRGNLPKNCQFPAYRILDFSREFTTKTELENLKWDLLRLAYQGILVVERILGRNNRMYMRFILQTALIAKKKNRMEKVRQLIEHIQEYCYETTIVGANLGYFKDLFNTIAECSDRNNFFKFGGFAIFKIIAQTSVKTWLHLKGYVNTYPTFVNRYYSELIDTFLYMTSVTKTLISSEEYLGQFKEVVKRVLDQNLRILHHKSILHRALELTKTEPHASVELIRFLLESGADVNSRDYCDRTPMMYVLNHVPGNIRNDVFEVFAAYGCRPVS